MSSFSDSARCRCPFVSPADVRLNIARRPRSEVERVGAAASPKAYVAARCGGEWSCASRWCESGDDVWGIDTETSDMAMGDGEEEESGDGLELALRFVVSVGVGGGDSRYLVIPSLRFESMEDVISTR